MELRNEAIACLALADIRIVKEWEGWPAGSQGLAFDGDLERYAYSDTKGNISVRLVADGRDMGTVIFPQAQLKVFLTASPTERAQRRYKQLKDKGSDVSLPALSREIAERDARDSTRAVAPLKPAPDAAVIDSTALTIEQVVDRVLALGASRSLWPPVGPRSA